MLFFWWFLQNVKTTVDHCNFELLIRLCHANCLHPFFWLSESQFILSSNLQNRSYVLNCYRRYICCDLKFVLCQAHRLSTELQVKQWWGGSSYIHHMSPSVYCHIKQIHWFGHFFLFCFSILSHFESHLLVHFRNGSTSIFSVALFNYRDSVTRFLILRFL